MVSLENCLKRYKKCIGTTSLRTRLGTKHASVPGPALQPIIDKSKIIPMPHINYFKLQPGCVKEYIFPGDRSPAAATPMNRSDPRISVGNMTRNCGSANNSVSISTTDTFGFGATMKRPPLPPPRAPIRQSAAAERPTGEEPEDDITIADEFYADETHVSDDLAKRKVGVGRYSAGCGLSPSATYFAKGIPVPDLRPRAMSSFFKVTTGLFNRPEKGRKAPAGRSGTAVVESEAKSAILLAPAQSLYVPRTVLPGRESPLPPMPKGQSYGVAKKEIEDEANDLEFSQEESVEAEAEVSGARNWEQSANVLLLEDKHRLDAPNTGQPKAKDLDVTPKNAREVDISHVLELTSGIFSTKRRSGDRPQSIYSNLFANV